MACPLISTIRYFPRLLCAAQNLNELRAAWPMEQQGTDHVYGSFYRGPSPVVVLLNSGLNPTAATDNFLNGGTYQTSVCDFVCVAVTHSVGGTTGYEFGIGTPGASVSTTVSTPLGGRHW